MRRSCEQRLYSGFCSGIVGRREGKAFLQAKTVALLGLSDAAFSELRRVRQAYADRIETNGNFDLNRIEFVRGNREVTVEDKVSPDASFVFLFIGKAGPFGRIATYLVPANSRKKQVRVSLLRKDQGVWKKLISPAFKRIRFGQEPRCWSGPVADLRPLRTRRFSSPDPVRVEHLDYGLRLLSFGEYLSDVERLHPDFRFSDRDFPACREYRPDLHF